MKSVLIYTFLFHCAGALLFAQTSADSVWRIPGYSSYVELNDGTVFCGEEYSSYHEGVTGKVCAGGQYSSYHEGVTGQVACGGQYSSYHQGVTGNVCFGGYSAHAVGKTLYPPGYGVYSITSESMNWPLVDSCIVNQSDR